MESSESVFHQFTPSYKVSFYIFPIVFVDLLLVSLQHSSFSIYLLKTVTFLSLSVFPFDHSGPEAQKVFGGSHCLTMSRNAGWGSGALGKQPQSPSLSAPLGWADQSLEQQPGTFRLIIPRWCHQGSQARERQKKINIHANLVLGEMSSQPQICLFIKSWAHEQNKSARHLRKDSPYNFRALALHVNVPSTTLSNLWCFRRKWKARQINNNNNNTPLPIF